MYELAPGGVAVSYSTAMRDFGTKGMRKAVMPRRFGEINLQRA